LGRRPSMNEDWPARVKRLEEEVAGLRQAMHTRGLIEQAKGMIAERLGCDPESAFRILSTRSQETNTPLVRVAADMVAALPAELPPGASKRASERVPDKAGASSIGLADPRAPAHEAPELRTITGLDRRAKAPALSMTANRALRLAIAAMDAASDLAELTRAVATVGLKGQPDAAVAIFATEPDGAIRLLACHGWPARAASDWRRVPSSVNTSVAHVLRTAAPLVLDGMTEHDFVLVGPGVARLTFPLAIEDRMVGALVLAWPTPRRFGEALRLYLAHLAVAAGRVINGLWPAVVADDAAAITTDLDWVRAVLDGAHGNAYLLNPVRDRDGSVVDFRIEAVSGAVGESVLGRRLLDVNPLLADNGVFAAYVDVLARGQTWQRPAATEQTIINGRKRRTVVTRRASRVGGAVLGSWERLDEMISKEQHLARLEAFGGLGWAEWDLTTGEGRWSAGMYRLLGKDSNREPPPFEALPDIADPADRGRAERFVAEVATGRDGVVDIRVKDCGARNGEVRWLRLFCEAQPVNVPQKTIYLLAQDISDRYAREQHLRSLQSRAAAGRLRLASQQDLTARLVDLLYPKETVALSVPGVSVRGRHFLPDTELPLRADFCDAVALPGGSVMMLIGDMFGAGLTAAATAVRLVRPVLALGLAGVPLTRVLEVLNRDLRRDEEPSMASLMLAKFEPLSGELRYTSAGHLPPILLKRGTGAGTYKPHLLSGNGGPVLGLIEDATFIEFSAHLEPGDAVVGYTDGVVDRRQVNPLASLATSFLKGYREGGPEALLALQVPQVTDEACVAVLKVDD
jgi:Stage II sporulation protein E (SpoIIE)/ANTAR domain